MSKLHKSDTFDSKDNKCQLMPFYYDFILHYVLSISMFVHQMTLLVFIIHSSLWLGVKFIIRL